MTRRISGTRPFSNTYYPRREKEKTACRKLPSHSDAANFHPSKKWIICVKDYVALWMANKFNLVSKMIYARGTAQLHYFCFHTPYPADLSVRPTTFRNIPSALAAFLWHPVTPRAHALPSLSTPGQVDQNPVRPFIGPGTPWWIMDRCLTLMIISTFWESPWECGHKVWDSQLGQKSDYGLRCD